jgi:AcrR family transcriptional regulator
LVSGSIGAVRGTAPERRSEAARIAVLQAADDLLAERGYDALTVEGIAARAGVAKQTIYRWWPSKTEILLDTLAEDAGTSLVRPDTGAVREDVREHLSGYARFLADDPAGRVLLALVGRAQHDAAMAASFGEGFLAGQRALDRAILERGVERGELPASLDLDDAIDRLSGPVLYRALVGRPPASEAFIGALVASVLGPG